MNAQGHELMYCLQERLTPSAVSHRILAFHLYNAEYTCSVAYLLIVTSRSDV